MVPWLECDLGKAKGCLIGVGYDSSSSEQPGQRNAPKAVRERLCSSFGYDLGLGRNVFENVRDLGDLEVAYSSAAETEKRLEHTLRMLSEKSSAVPLIIGGEHTITLFASRALSRIAGEKEGRALLVFDAHLDLFEAFEGELSHMSYLKRACLEGLYEKIVLVGARACAAEEVEFLEKTGQDIEVFFMHEVEEKGLERVREEVLKELEGKKVYCSIDVDVLDPVYAIGTGSPESNGLSLGELKYLLELLKEKELVGLDLVEVNPLVDSSGITCFSGADIMKKVFSLL